MTAAPRADVAIRAAGPEDAGPILTLQRAAYVSEAVLVGDLGLPPLHQTLDDLAAELARCTSRCAELADGRLVGAVRLVVDGELGLVGRLVVAPDVQGRGVGTALLRAIEAAAPPAVRTFELFTSDRSLANLRLYARLGYLEHRRADVPGRGYGLVWLRRPREPLP